MPFDSGGFIDQLLPYLSLVAAVFGCLLLYLALGHQLQRMRYALTLQKHRIDSLESRLSKAGVTSESSTALAADSTKEKVLHLHSLGRSSQEIATTAGIRKAEVDFVINVNEHLRSPGGTALRKIS